MMTSNSPRVHELINKTHSTGGFPIEVPKAMRGQGTSRFVRPYTDMTVQEYDEVVKNLVLSGELTEKEKKEELKRLSKINPRRHRVPNLQPLNNAAELEYDPNPTTGFFRTVERNPNLQSYVSLDIETDDFKQPLSIAALKFQYNPATGQFEHVDTFQRFYSTDWKSIRKTHAVHGLSPAELKSLRNQQGADYSKIYDESEMRAVHQFMDGSIITGQNVVPFDLPALFQGAAIQNSTLDTMFIARNVWKDMPNDLDSIFTRIFGKTMEQAGLHHHMAHADTIATMMIMQEMIKWEGVTGKSIQYVMQHPQGFHLAQIDSYLPETEQIIKGSYLAALRGEIGAYMKAQDVGLTDVHGNLLPGVHYDRPEAIKPGDVEAVEGAIKDLKAYEKKHAGEVSETVNELTEAYESFSNWRRSDLIQKVSKAKSTKEAHELLKTAGYKTGAEGYESIIDQAKRLRAEREKNERSEFEMKRDLKIEKAKRHGWISRDDEAVLRATESFDELSDALDDVTTKNQKLLDIYSAFANIKPYDVNQYMAAAKTQWGGTMKAAQGVIPRFLLDPIGRLGEASFNYQEGKLAPWNAFNRTWNATIGQVGNAALGMGLSSGNPWAIGIGAVTGSIGAISQVYGNYKQQQMETKMLGIQNTLNTLGLITSWITAPFKLLQRATKLLTGSFTGLTLSINKFMQNGIGLMSQMGNPLTELTGVNYAAYEGTTMMDVASLFNRGSMNSVYEDFAKQQKAFYTMGQVNQNRLIASSLLGVYSDVYNPSTDIEGTYNSMVNKLLANMKYQSPEQQARTMYLASQIDNNLPGLLRTANMLGVTDVNELTDPGKRNMYWRPLDDTIKDKNGLTEVGRYRWTQYEYGAAQQQWNHSKMRLSNMVWTAVGKDFYNSVNVVVDKMASNDWKGALDEVANWWDTFKGKVTKVWDGIKSSLSGKDGDESSISSWSHGFKLLGLQIVKIALDVSETILNIWNSIMIQLADKAEGLVAYLSTISLTPHFNPKTKELSFELNHIGTAKSVDKSKSIYTAGWTNPETGEVGNLQVREGYGGYAALADIVYGDKLNDWQKTFITPDQLYWDTAAYLGAGNTIDLSEYGYNIPGGMVQHAEDLRALFTALGKADLKGPGFWKVATQINAADVPSEWKIANYDDEVGLASGLSSLIASGNDPVSTSLSIIRDAVDDKIQIELKFMDEQGHTKASMLIDKFQNGVAKAVTKLQDLVPNLQSGYKLEAVKTSPGN